MRKPALLATIALLPVLAWAGSPETMKERFDRAKENRDDALVEAVFAEWKIATPDDPQPYISLANYYFGRASGPVQLSTKPPDPGDYSITNPDTGEVVGSFGPAKPRLDPRVLERSVDTLSEATRRFPDRMDIWFGLAHILQESSSFERQYSTLEAAFTHATTHAERLRWKDGARLPDAPEKFIPETAQGYVSHYYEQETPEDDERFLRLAKLISKFYPRHIYPLNAIGIYHLLREQWREALPYMEKAHELDPVDAFVTMNLGILYTKLDQPEKARVCFRDIASSNADEDIRADARARLAALGN